MSAEPMAIARDFEDTGPMFFHSEFPELDDEVDVAEVPVDPRAEFPWWPAICVFGVVLGAFLPPFIEWVGS